ncbi:FecR family protein [Membranihabitans marinus]|uniref:FecR family protein n=1 Tax=Membranihabitans marinus TaxID=1227546 RepID=UPI001F1C04BC|nr:FecR domain-containing protein [Membranihabitans marinus]
MESRNNIEELYHKFLNKTATSDEIHQLLDWIEKTENADVILSAMEEKWGQGLEDKEYPGDWTEVVGRLDVLKHEISGKRQNRLQFFNRKMLHYAAAAILLMISTIMIWQNYAGPKTIEYSTHYGETKVVELPDGSVVRLNANSKLLWTNHWKKQGSREVILSGEAFFDVSHLLDDSDENYPFQVITDDLTIKVLGTTFNVSSRRDKTDVFLATGKVELAFSDASRTIESMEPGDMVSFSKNDGSYEKKETTTVKSASWTEGSFIYDNESLENILNEIEDIYGKEIQVVDREMLNKKYTIGLPYTNWDMVVESLALMMDLTIEKNEDGIIIK